MMSEVVEENTPQALAEYMRGLTDKEVNDLYVEVLEMDNRDFRVAVQGEINERYNGEREHIYKETYKLESEENQGPVGG